MSVVVVIGGFVAMDAWNSLSASVSNTLLAPNVDLLAYSFSPGGCQQNHVWVIPWFGNHVDVQANVTLRNNGWLGGYAKVTFTEDGSPIGEHDFYVGAGKTTPQTWQFTVNDCDSHTYGAQISGAQMG